MSGAGSAQIDGSGTELSRLIVPLLKGALYQDLDAAHWALLLRLQARVRDYVAVLGLDLVLDESEGYAFLRSRSEVADEPQTAALPRLVPRRPLPFSVSLLLALLRKKLAELDATGGDTRLVLSREDIVELLRIFLPDSSNEARLFDQVDVHITRIIELGFLRRLKPGPGQTEALEVRRILKAFVDAQWLSDFDQRLAGYRARLSIEASEVGDD